MLIFQKIFIGKIIKPKLTKNIAKDIFYQKSKNKKHNFDVWFFYVCGK